MNEVTLTPEQLKSIVKEVVKEVIPDETKATLTIHECAKYTGIGKDKLLELSHNPNSDFPRFKVGKKFLINREMLNDWLEKIVQEGRIL